MQVVLSSARMIHRKEKEAGNCILNERILRCKSIDIALPVCFMNLKKEGVR